MTSNTPSDGFSFDTLLSEWASLSNTPEIYKTHPEQLTELLHSAELNIPVLNLANFYHLLSISYAARHMPAEKTKYLKLAFETENDTQYLAFLILSLNAERNWEEIGTLLLNIDMEKLPEKFKGFGFRLLCKIAREVQTLRQDCAGNQRSWNQISNLIQQGDAVALGNFTNVFLQALKQHHNSAECNQLVDQFLTKLKTEYDDVALSYYNDNFGDAHP